MNYRNLKLDGGGTFIKNLNIQLTRKEQQLFKEKHNVSIDAILYFSRGLEYEDQGDSKRARKLYIKALQIEPDFNKAKIRLRAVTEGTN